MRKLLSFIALTVASLSLNAQDSVSVLFIGNSYTSANNLPSIINSIAVSKGKEISYDTQLQGGATLQTHASNAATYTKIKSKKWDYVVIQAQSQEPSFPDTQVDTQTIPYAIQLADSVRANNFCTSVLFFMTWGRENGDPQWAPISTYEGMQMRLRNAYVRMKDSVQGSVAPVGMAWWDVRDNAPTIQMYTADGSHPNYAGSYLTACTFYAALFEDTPIGATFLGSLDAITAAQLQSSASVATLDSLEQWSIRGPQDQTIADFTSNNFDPDVQFDNSSWCATSYTWSFGDGGTSTDENPLYQYTSNGTYTVQLIAESECNSDTLEQQITINTASVITNEESQLSLKHYADGDIVISGMTIPSEVALYTHSGQLLEMKKSYSVSALFELSKYGNGVFLIRISSNDGVTDFKVIHP
ncbi:MAG: PKD domain-containing protein [Crocinitomicaceae bacterium]